MATSTAFQLNCLESSSNQSGNDEESVIKEENKITEGLDSTPPEIWNLWYDVISEKLVFLENELSVQIKDLESMQKEIGEIKTLSQDFTPQQEHSPTKSLEDCKEISELEFLSCGMFSKLLRDVLIKVQQNLVKRNSTAQTLNHDLVKLKKYIEVYKTKLDLHNSHFHQMLPSEVSKTESFHLYKENVNSQMQCTLPTSNFKCNHEQNCFLKSICEENKMMKVCLHNIFVKLKAYCFTDDQLVNESNDYQPDFLMMENAIFLVQSTYKTCEKFVDFHCNLQNELLKFKRSLPSKDNYLGQMSSNPNIWGSEDLSLNKKVGKQFEVHNAKVEFLDVSVENEYREIKTATEGMRKATPPPFSVRKMLSTKSTDVEHRINIMTKDNLRADLLYAQKQLEMFQTKIFEAVQLVQDVEMGVNSDEDLVAIVISITEECSALRQEVSYLRKLRQEKKESWNKLQRFIMDAEKTLENSGRNVTSLREIVRTLGHVIASSDSTSLDETFLYLYSNQLDWLEKLTTGYENFIGCSTIIDDVRKENIPLKKEMTNDIVQQKTIATQTPRQFLQNQKYLYDRDLKHNMHDMSVQADSAFSSLDDEPENSNTFDSFSVREISREIYVLHEIQEEFDSMDFTDKSENVKMKPMNINYFTTIEFENFTDELYTSCFPKHVFFQSDPFNKIDNLVCNEMETNESVVEVMGGNNFYSNREITYNDVQSFSDGEKPVHLLPSCYAIKELSEEEYIENEEPPLPTENNDFNSGEFEMDENSEFENISKPSFHTLMKSDDTLESMVLLNIHSASNLFQQHSPLQPVINLDRTLCAVDPLTNINMCSPLLDHSLKCKIHNASAEIDGIHRYICNNSVFNSGTFNCSIRHPYKNDLSIIDILILNKKWLSSFLCTLNTEVLFLSIKENFCSSNDLSAAVSFSRPFNKHLVHLMENNIEISQDTCKELAILFKNVFHKKGLIEGIPASSVIFEFSMSDIIVHYFSNIIPLNANLSLKDLNFKLDTPNKFSESVVRSPVQQPPLLQNAGTDSIFLNKKILNSNTIELATVPSENEVRILTPRQTKCSTNKENATIGVAFLSLLNETKIFQSHYNLHGVIFTSGQLNLYLRKPETCVIMFQCPFVIEFLQSILCACFMNSERTLALIETTVVEKILNFEEQMALSKFTQLFQKHLFSKDQFSEKVCMFKINPKIPDCDSSNDEQIASSCISGIHNINTPHADVHHHDAFYGQSLLLKPRKYLKLPKQFNQSGVKIIFSDEDFVETQVPLNFALPSNVADMLETYPNENSHYVPDKHEHTAISVSDIVGSSMDGIIRTCTSTQTDEDVYMIMQHKISDLEKTLTEVNNTEKYNLQLQYDMAEQMTICEQAENALKEKIDVCDKRRITEVGLAHQEITLHETSLRDEITALKDNLNQQNVVLHRLKEDADEASQALIEKDNLLVVLQNEIQSLNNQLSEKEIKLSHLVVVEDQCSQTIDMQELVKYQTLMDETNQLRQSNNCMMQRC